MTQVQQDLEATYDYLESHGWCRGAFQKPDGRVCLEGAAAAVTMGAPNYWGTRRVHEQGAYSRPIEFFEKDGTLLSWPGLDWAVQWHDVPRESIDRYADVLDALAARMPRVARYGAFLWNDEPGRTVDDVKELIRNAIKAEAEK